MLSCTSAQHLFKRVHLVPLSALALAGLVALSGANQEWFYTINRLSVYAFPGFWANWTVLGDALLVLALTLPWVGRRPGLVWKMFCAAVVTAVLIQTGKIVFNVPRPPAVLPPESFFSVGPVLSSKAFPSGHTATAFMFAAVMSACFPSRGLRIALLIMAAGVGVSRIMVGVHWPLDVLVGAAVGWWGALAGMCLAGHWRFGMTRAGQQVLAALLVSATVYLLLLYDSRYPQAALLEFIVAGVALSLGLPGAARLWRHRVTR